jgi:hypothetical protein
MSTRMSAGEVPDEGGDRPSDTPVDQVGLTAVRPLPVEEKKKFVLALVNGGVFTDHHIRKPEMIPMVFMPIALGALSGSSESYIKSIGLIYEYMDAAQSRSIDGMPTFFSCRMMNVADAEECLAAYNELKKSRLSEEYLLGTMLKDAGTDGAPEGSASDRSEETVGTVPSSELCVRPTEER